ncbi:MAG: hypothetical protein KAS53_02275 [Candidatus Cloacimonetes bacterium]|nr:hypothetical protein [Candidatus Cloacimonadota bacterium]
MEDVKTSPHPSLERRGKLSEFAVNKINVVLLVHLEQDSRKDLKKRSQDKLRIEKK